MKANSSAHHTGLLLVRGATRRRKFDIQTPKGVGRFLSRALNVGALLTTVRNLPI
jgi:hypothetical protein